MNKKVSSFNANENALHSFELALQKLQKESTNFQELVDNIHSLNNRFFYQASIISLLIIDNGEQKVYTPGSLNELPRSIEDWGLQDQKSILNYALKTKPGTLLNIMDVPVQSLGGFYKIPADFSSILSEQNNEKWAANFIVYQNVPQIENYQLLRKEVPEDKSEAPVCSAILTPLRDLEDQVTGALLIGNDYFRSYSTDSSKPSIIKLLDLQRLIQVISFTAQHLLLTNKPRGS